MPQMYTPPATEQTKTAPNVQFQVLEGPQNGTGQMVNVAVPAGAGLFIQFETPEDDSAELIDSLTQMVIKLTLAVQPSNPDLAREAQDLLFAHNLIEAESSAAEDSVAVVDTPPEATAQETPTPTPAAEPPANEVAASVPAPQTQSAPKSGSFMGLTKPATTVNKPNPVQTPAPASQTAPQPAKAAPAGGLMFNKNKAAPTANTPAAAPAPATTTAAAAPKPAAQQAKAGGKSPFSFR